MRSVFLPALMTLVLAVDCAPVSAQSKFFTFERNSDRFGSDYFNLDAKSAEDCSFECQKENRCRAWSYVKSTGRCFLKDPAPAAKKNTCCTSGVRNVKGSRID